MTEKTFEKQMIRPERGDIYTEFVIGGSGLGIDPKDGDIWREDIGVERVI